MKKFKLLMVIMLLCLAFTLEAWTPYSGYVIDGTNGNVTIINMHAIDGTTITATTFTDGTLSISSGSITGAVGATYTGTIEAEHLISTDDALIKNILTLGDDTANLTGQINWIASDNDLASFTFGTSDAMAITGFTGGFDIDGDFTAGTMASDAGVSGTTLTGTGKISTTVTTEQLRLNYDATNLAISP